MKSEADMANSSTLETNKALVRRHCADALHDPAVCFGASHEKWGRMAQIGLVYGLYDDGG